MFDGLDGSQLKLEIGTVYLSSFEVSCYGVLPFHTVCRASVMTTISPPNRDWGYSFLVGVVSAMVGLERLALHGGFWWNPKFWTDV